MQSSKRSFDFLKKHPCEVTSSFPIVQSLIWNDTAGKCETPIQVLCCVPFQWLPSNAIRDPVSGLTDLSWTAVLIQNLCNKLYILYIYNWSGSHTDLTNIRGRGDRKWRHEDVFFVCLFSCCCGGCSSCCQRYHDCQNQKVVGAQFLTQWRFYFLTIYLWS